MTLRLGKLKINGRTHMGVTKADFEHVCVCVCVCELVSA